MSARSLNLHGNRRQGNITIVRIAFHYDIFLHNNRIAHINYNTRQVTISDCGWNTTTTKTAINNVLRQLGLKSLIFQKKGIWYINVPSDMYMNATNETIVFDGKLTLKF